VNGENTVPDDAATLHSVRLKNCIFGERDLWARLK
jgi:hypothetical protein